MYICVSFDELLMFLLTNLSYQARGTCCQKSCSMLHERESVGLFYKYLCTDLNSFF